MPDLKFYLKITEKRKKKKSFFTRAVLKTLYLICLTRKKQEKTL